MSISSVRQNGDRRSAPQVAGPQPGLGQPGELERVLDAWNVATKRLQRTHEALREEVHRLTNEFEIKNRELCRRTGWPIWGGWPRMWHTKSAMGWPR